MPDQAFPQFSCYLLPGHSQSPADAMDEARQAEALGLGRVWLSERFDVKDAGVICAVEAMGGLGFERIPNLGGRWVLAEDEQLDLGDRVLLIDPADRISRSTVPGSGSSSSTACRTRARLPDDGILSTARK